MNALKKVWGIFLIVSVCLVVSCSEDNAPVLTDPTEMCETNVVFRNETLSLQINGVPFPDGLVQFEPVEGDSTRLMMYISNYVPERSVEILVKVTPGEGNVTFEGTTDGMLKSYQAETKGVYRSNPDGSRQIEAECTISTAVGFTEIPFEYHFAKNMLHVSTGLGGTVEWQGKEIEKWDFVQSVLDKISLRFAQEITDVKLVFHSDTTFDIWLKWAGQSEYVLWMTPRFWIENDYVQLMAWIFTREQYEQFCTQWLGTLDFETVSPFRPLVGGEYELPILCWASAENFTCTIRNPQRYAALDMFLKGEFMEGLTDEEKREMEMFSDILYDVDDLSDSMSWCIKVLCNK